MSALNPVFTVGSQISDALRTNLGMSRKEARERVIELLNLVGIPSPESRYGNYVHEFSGGMRQRVMLAHGPQLQSFFPDCRRAHHRARRDHSGHYSRTYPEHDRTLSHVADFLLPTTWASSPTTCDTIGVMYASHLVELGTKNEIFANPLHPYTQGPAELHSAPRHAGEIPGRPIKGLVCNMLEPPQGCKFNPRCEHAHGRLQPGSAAAQRGGARALRGLSSASMSRAGETGPPNE